MRHLMLKIAVAQASLEHFNDLAIATGLLLYYDTETEQQREEYFALKRARDILIEVCRELDLRLLTIEDYGYSESATKKVESKLNAK